MSGDEREDNARGYDTINEEQEESATTQTQTQTYIHNHKHLTGGVSVEVDEHLDKNREISVTPIPSQTSVVTSVTNLGHNPSSIFARNISSTIVTATRKTKNVKASPITPYGSQRQRFGSTTVTSVTGGIGHQLSVTIDDKEIQQIRKQTASSTTQQINKRTTDSDDNKKEMSQSPHSRTNILMHPTQSNDNVTHNPPSPSSMNGGGGGGGENITLRGIGFGDMPIDIEEAKKKTRQIAHKLYMKYLHIGAEYEINIPHRTRKKLLKIKLDNIDEWMEETKASINDLYKLFDECMEEMFALMRSSITVFLETEEYQKIVDKY